MQTKRLKRLGSRQRAVLMLFKDARYVSRREVYDACPWAQVEFFLDRTLKRLVERGLVEFRPYCGYRLRVNRKSAEWQGIIRR